MQVKRFTMGFLRMNEESRPLVARHQRSSPNSPARRGYFYHYINAGIYDVDNKFGDSCRQSLDGIETTNINKNNIEFDFKRNLMRETSSANCSPKKFMSTTLKRTDSLNANHTLMDEDDNEFELKEATWFQSGPHEISLEVLAQQSPGAFLVRKSAKSGCFALSVRVPTPGPKVRHYLIMRTARGYKIKVSWAFYELLCWIYCNYLLTGLHERIFIAKSSNHTPLSNARAAASPISSASSSKYSQEKQERWLRHLQHPKGFEINILGFGCLLLVLRRNFHRNKKYVYLCKSEYWKNTNKVWFQVIVRMECVNMRI